MLGCISGLMGTMSYMRKQTLLADAVAHATLPGIALTFLIVPQASIALLVFGGSLTGMLGAWCVEYLAILPLKKDAVIGTILASFLGLGLILMTCIQKTSNARQACLNKFLYGNASLVLNEDLFLIFVIAGMLFIIMALLLPTYQARLFDATFADTTALAPWWWDTIFTLLFVIVIAVGIHTVGIILMSSMLICPILTTFSPYRSFTKNCYTSALWAGLATALGSYISYLLIAPPGPCITVTQAIFAVTSIMVRTYVRKQTS